MPKFEKDEDQQLSKLHKQKEIIENKQMIRELRMKNQRLLEELRAINRLKMNPKSLVNIFKSKYHIRTKAKQSEKQVTAKTSNTK